MRLKLRPLRWFQLVWDASLSNPSIDCQSGANRLPVCLSVSQSFSQSVNWQRHRQSDRQSNQIIAPCAVDNCHRVSPYLPSYLLSLSLSLSACLCIPLCVCPSVIQVFATILFEHSSQTACAQLIPSLFSLDDPRIKRTFARSHFRFDRYIGPIYICTIYSYLQYLYALLGNSRLGCEPNTLRLSLARKYFLCPLTVPCSLCRVLAAAF